MASNQTLAQRIKNSLDTGRLEFIENNIGVAYTMTRGDNGVRLVFTAAVTVTIPTLGVLGNGFECEIVNDSGGSVILDGPGSTNVTLTDGQVACVLEVNGKQRVVIGDSTVIS